MPGKIYPRKIYLPKLEFWVFLSSYVHFIQTPMDLISPGINQPDVK